MTIAQLEQQLLWLLDQLAAIHEAYSSSGMDAAQYLAPDNSVISKGDALWRLNDRIQSTRIALRCRQEIAGILPVSPVIPGG